MARETGLEPATSGVTGRRSNQLSYSPVRGRPDRPAASKSSAARRDRACCSARSESDVAKTPARASPPASARGCVGLQRFRRVRRHRVDAHLPRVAGDNATSRRVGEAARHCAGAAGRRLLVLDDRHAMQRDPAAGGRDALHRRPSSRRRRPTRIRPANGPARSPSLPKLGRRSRPMPAGAARGPSSIEATTLPPGELMNTTPRKLGVARGRRAKSTKTSGVSGSITPSATITLGTFRAAAAPFAAARRETHRRRLGEAQAGERASPTP